MDKKTYVLSLLKKLEPYWEWFSDLIVNVELWVCDENDIDKIIQVIENQIKNIKDVKLKKVFESTKSILEKIRNEEFIQRQKEEKELEELLAMIEVL
jgi:hypothetical protein